MTAKVAMIHALVLNLAKATGGVLHPVGVTLVLVTAAASGLNALLLWWADRRLGDGLVGGGRGAPWRELARRHRDFPLYRAPQVTLNALSQSLPVLLLAAFFGTAAAGHYSLAASVLAAPMVLLAKSVNDVFYPHVASAVNRGEPITASLAKTTLVMAAVGLVPFGAMVVLGPWLFALLFGDPWWQAGEYARWMAVWLYKGLSYDRISASLRQDGEAGVAMRSGGGRPPVAASGDKTGAPARVRAAARTRRSRPEGNRGGAKSFGFACGLARRGSLRRAAIASSRRQRLAGQRPGRPEGPPFQ